MFAQSVIAGVLVVSALAAPSPSPSPAPSASGIPEIGRVRVQTPPCTAMRDLVFPSFAAAEKANRVFLEGAPAYAKYAEIAGNFMSDDKLNARFGKAHQPASSDGATLNERNFYLARMSKDLATILQQELPIAKALGDPRISEAAAANDPVIAAERTELQRLYAVQAGRAAVLNEFLLREGVKVAREDDGDAAGLSSNTLAPQATPTPFSSDRVPFGQPPTIGNDGNADANAVKTWTTAMAQAARAASIDLARDMYPIAQSCQ
jgi:hypothetical protein